MKKKKGTLKSGRRGKKVSKQTIARKAGAKVPKEKSSGTRKKSAGRKKAVECSLCTRVRKVNSVINAFLKVGKVYVA